MNWNRTWVLGGLVLLGALSFVVSCGKGTAVDAQQDDALTNDAQNFPSINLNEDTLLLYNSEMGGGTSVPGPALSSSGTVVDLSSSTGGTGVSSSTGIVGVSSSTGVVGISSSTGIVGISSSSGIKLSSSLAPSSSMAPSSSSKPVSSSVAASSSVAVSSSVAAVSSSAAASSTCNVTCDITPNGAGAITVITFDSGTKTATINLLAVPAQAKFSKTTCTSPTVTMNGTAATLADWGADFSIQIPSSVTTAPISMVITGCTTTTLSSYKW